MYPFLKLRKLTLEKNLSYRLIYKLFGTMSDPEQRAQRLGSVGTGAGEGGKGRAERCRCPADCRTVEVGGCGELHLRREQDLKGELESPAENRWFERFSMKGLLTDVGMGI